MAIAELLGPHTSMDIFVCMWALVCVDFVFYMFAVYVFGCGVWGCGEGEGASERNAAECEGGWKCTSAES